MIKRDASSSVVIFSILRLALLWSSWEFEPYSVRDFFDQAQASGREEVTGLCIPYIYLQSCWFHYVIFSLHLDKLRHFLFHKLWITSEMHSRSSPPQSFRY